MYHLIVDSFPGGAVRVECGECAPSHETNVIVSDYESLTAALEAARELVSSPINPGRFSLCPHCVPGVEAERRRLACVVGGRLAEWRRDPAWLAEQSGAGLDTVEAIILATHPAPRRQTLRQIAAALEIPVQRLLPLGDMT